MVIFYRSGKSGVFKGDAMDNKINLYITGCRETRQVSRLKGEPMI